MKQTFTVLALLISQIAYGVVITPDNNPSEGAIVIMTTDTRTGQEYVNGVINDGGVNKFQVEDEGRNQLGGWGLELKLNEDEYGFQQGETSTLTIAIDGNAPNAAKETDVFFAFSIGPNKYFTFVTDLDDYFNIYWDTGRTPARTGQFIYPDPADGTGLADGDAAVLYSSISYNPALGVGSLSSGGQIRQALADGDETNWATFKTTPRGENNVPFQFVITNDDAAKTLSITYDGVTKTFTNTGDLTAQNFRLFIGTDVNINVGKAEALTIASITVTGDNVGLEGCDFDIDAYLERCYCADTQSGMGSPFSNVQNKYRNDYQGYDDMNRYYGDYDSYKYAQPNYYQPQQPSNGNFIGYLNLLLTSVILTYIVCINGCGRIKGGGNRKKYEKVYNYDSEQNAINA